MHQLRPRQHNSYGPVVERDRSHSPWARALAEPYTLRLSEVAAEGEGVEEQCEVGVEAGEGEELCYDYDYPLYTLD